MKSGEKKIPRTGAYLLYVTDRGIEFDKAIRKIATAKPMFNSKLCLETHKNSTI